MDSHQDKLQRIITAAEKGDFSLAKDLIPLFDIFNYSRLLESSPARIIALGRNFDTLGGQVRNVSSISDLDVSDFELDAIHSSALLLYSALAPLQELRALEGPLLHENPSLRAEALKVSSVGGGLLSLVPVFMEAWEKSEGAYEFEMAELAVWELLGSEDLLRMIYLRSYDAEFFDQASLLYEKLLEEYGVDAIVWRGKLLDPVAVFQEYEREHRNPCGDTLILKRRIQMWTGKILPERFKGSSEIEETLEILTPFEVGKRYFHRVLVP